MDKFSDKPEIINESSAYYGESSSGEQTPMSNYSSAEPRGKKRVGWGSLPKVNDDDEGEVDERAGDQEEQLAQIHQTLSNTLPVYNKRKPSSPPRRLGAHATLLPPNTNRPRSVLRSGTSTPQFLDEDMYSGIPNIEGKVRSQNDAANRARVLEDDVSRDPSREPSPERPRQHRPRKHQSSSRQSLFHLSDSPLDSGAATPTEEYDDYVPKPKQWRVGGLSALQLATRIFGGSHSRPGSPDDSGESTPISRHTSPSHSRHGSTLSLTDLVQSSIALGGSIGRHETASIAKSRRPHVTRRSSDDGTPSFSKHSRPAFPRSSSASFLEGIGKIGNSLKPSRKEEQARIENHVKENALRHRFLLKLCRALMQYGAPTHRLEEYMKMSARVLEVEAQFLYIPGCMIVSFDDSRSHTTEVKLVRTNQGVDLGKLHDTHDIYKEVVHDIIGVDEATERLDEILKRADKFSLWSRVVTYGFASAFVGPFAFGARLIDLPIAFLLGCILGFLQLIMSNQNDLYSSLFEIIAVLVTSFLARAFGSIRGGNLFCFAALAQSAIALILPGYIVLSGALELQAKSIVAGSVRLVYAIIYSLFIGFGLTLGIAIYGIIDENATSATTCQNPISGQGYWLFCFVPLYTVCLMVINQAKYKQMPVMLLISFVGYVVNYFSSRRFVGNAQIASALGALSIAFMANVYSRIGMKLDEPTARFVRYCKMLLKRKRSKVPDISTEPPTPSTLEHQIEKDQVDDDTRVWLFRLTHFGRAPPPRTRLRSSSQSSLASDATQDPVKEGLDHHSAESPEDPKRLRIHYSLAAAAMLPAIFVQVPSGLSVSGSLVQGIATGDQISKNSTGGTLSAGDIFSGNYSSNPTSDISFTVGYSVLEVAVGLAVGLFLGTLLVYPMGKGGSGAGRKMRSGLFSF